MEPGTELEEAVQLGSTWQGQCGGRRGEAIRLPSARGTRTGRWEGRKAGGGVDGGGGRRCKAHRPVGWAAGERRCCRVRARGGSRAQRRSRSVCYTDTQPPSSGVQEGSRVGRQLSYTTRKPTHTRNTPPTFKHAAVNWTIKLACLPRACHAPQLVVGGWMPPPQGRTYTCEGEGRGGGEPASPHPCAPPQRQPPLQPHAIGGGLVRAGRIGG